MTDVNSKHEAEAKAGETTASHADGFAATPEVAAVEADIARTRDELAQTVDQLTSKLDVKTRVRNRMAHARDDTAHELRAVRNLATDARGKPTPAATAAGGAVIVALAVVSFLAVWRRLSESSRRRWR